MAGRTFVRGDEFGDAERLRFIASSARMPPSTPLHLSRSPFHCGGWLVQGESVGLGVDSFVAIRCRLDGAVGYGCELSAAGCVIPGYRFGTTGLKRQSVDSRASAS